MRVEFTQAIQPIFDSNEKTFFITGDLGYNALEGMASKHRRRFLNAGVAEQNMMGVAAGLALTGLEPWVYSIIPFTTLRCLEQIRNDVALHRLPVRIVGNGGGYTYGVMGSTHHALEDLAVLKAMPEMSLFFPVAGDQVAAAVSLLDRLKGPGFLRLAISPFATTLKPIHENPVTLTRRYSDGGDITVLGIGHGAQIALAALKSGALGAADVFGVARFPFDPTSDVALWESVARTRRVIVVEEHYRAGGMGESLRVALPASLDFFEILCPYYSPEQKYGSPRFHLDQCGVNPDALVELVRRGRVT